MTSAPRATQRAAGASPGEYSPGATMRHAPLTCLCAAAAAPRRRARGARRAPQLKSQTCAASAAAPGGARGARVGGKQRFETSLLPLRLPPLAAMQGQNQGAETALRPRTVTRLPPCSSCSSRHRSGGGAAASAAAWGRGRGRVGSVSALPLPAARIGTLRGGRVGVQLRQCCIYALGPMLNSCTHQRSTQCWDSWDSCSRERHRLQSAGDRAPL